MLPTFDRVLIRLNRWAVIAMLAAMAAMVFANVALRFLTDHSILWVEEVSRYLMIWLTFLGAGLVLRYGGHVGIDTLQERCRGTPRWIRAAIFVLLLVFFATMLWLGARYAMVTWGQTTPVHADPDRRRLPGDADRLRADDRPPRADGGRVRAAGTVPGRRRIRRGRGQAVIAALFIGCIVLLALGVPVAFALGGAHARRDPRPRQPAARRAAQVPVQRDRRVRADGGAVLHPDRRADDRRRAVRGAAAVRVAVRRPLPRRARAHEHPRDHVLLRASAARRWRTPPARARS